MNYLASVIIPTYNRSRLLDSTLISLTNQSQDPGTFEVIVIDDGSTDNTRQISEKYKDRLHIRYFFQEDRGFRAAKARNVGIQHAQSDICIFVDTGVLLAGRCVTEHIKSHQQERSPLTVIGYAFGFGVAENDAQSLQKMVNPLKVDDTIAHFLSLNQYFDRREAYYQKYQDDISTLPAPWITFWTCNVSVSRSALLNINGFDENFQSWGVEDSECGFRLFENGVKFVLNRRAAAVHAPHEKNSANRKSELKNMLYFHKKHHQQNPIVSRYFLTSRWDELNDRLLRAYA